MSRRKLGRMSLWARALLFLFILIALAAPFLANDQPIYYRDAQSIEWPILKSDTYSTLDWKQADGSMLFPLIPFAPTKTNLAQRYLPPLSVETIGNRSFRHWLGTDRLGRDVAAGMIHGCRKSLWVGLLAMLLAASFGVVFGALAGYFGNKRLRTSWPWLALLILVFCYLLYLTFYGLITTLLATLLLGLLFSIGLWHTMSQRKLRAGLDLKGSVSIPADDLLMRTVEIITTLPTLLFLMVIGTLLSAPSLSILAVMIAILRWPRFAVFVRSEVQKLKAENHITAARISGLSDIQILQKLILPQTLISVSVLFSFGVASTIMLESTLSFLGIGVPVDTVTWGSILGQSRENISAWWLAVFPGLAIGIIIFTLNHVGDYLHRGSEEWATN